MATPTGSAPTRLEFIATAKPIANNRFIGPLRCLPNPMNRPSGKLFHGFPAELPRTEIVVARLAFGGAEKAEMKTHMDKPQGRDEARQLHVVIETREDYALAQQRIEALRRGPKDASSEQELTALIRAVSDWDDEKERKPGYPV